jgi:hypothetical protein
MSTKGENLGACYEKLFVGKYLDRLETISSLDVWTLALWSSSKDVERKLEEGRYRDERERNDYGRQRAELPQEKGDLTWSL